MSSDSKPNSFRKSPRNKRRSTISDHKITNKSLNVSPLNKNRDTKSQSLRSLLTEGTIKKKKKRTRCRVVIPEIDTDDYDSNISFESPRIKSARISDNKSKTSGSSIVNRNSDRPKLVKSSSLKNTKNYLENELKKQKKHKEKQKKQQEDNYDEDSIKIQNISDTPLLKSFVISDPTSFRRLVDQESKRASILLGSQNAEVGFSTEGLSDEDKHILQQLQRIRNGENPDENIQEINFKKQYSIEYYKSSEEKKLELKQYPALLELLETEKSFIKRLQITIKMFLFPIREQKLLNTFETVTLFSNIENVLECNENILKDLELVIELPKKDLGIKPTYLQWISEIFIKHIPIMEPIYALYCTNQPIIESTITKYKEDAKFASFLRLTLKKPQCLKQNLNSLLITPLQRLCKYPLLFKELLKIPTDLQSKEFKILQQAYNTIKKCVNNVNSKVKKVENLTKVTEILMELSNGQQFRNLLVDASREFIMKEFMIVNEKIRRVYLFDNLLIITKQTPKELKLNPNSNTMEYFILHVIPLKNIKLYKIDNQDYTFGIETNSTYSFKCKDKFQYKKWFRKIKQLHKIAPTTSTQEVQHRPRVIRLESPNEKQKKKSLKFSFSSKSKIIEETLVSPRVDKLQQNLKNEQIRRKIEEDNTLQFKILYDDLKEKYEKETKQYQIEIKQLKDELTLLKETNISLKQQLKDTLKGK